MSSELEQLHKDSLCRWGHIHSHEEEGCRHVFLRDAIKPTSKAKAMQQNLWVNASLKSYHLNWPHQGIHCKHGKVKKTKACATGTRLSCSPSTQSTFLPRRLMMNTGSFKVISKRSHTTRSLFFCSGAGRGRKKADYPDEEIIILMSEKIIIWNFSGWSPAGNFNWLLKRLDMSNLLWVTVYIKMRIYCLVFLGIRKFSIR